MSAYAALISLHQILVTIVYFQPWITHSTNQLQILIINAAFLLKFLDASSRAQTSALETKMRDAAYKAEDLIEFGILDSESRMSYSHMRITFFYCLYIIFVIVSGFLLLSYVKLEAVPARTEFILEIMYCLMNALFLYLCIREIYVFPPLDDSPELNRVLYDFEIIVMEANRISEAREMSSHEALVSLRRIVDYILDSGDKEQLRPLQEKVIFLLDFLGNPSTAYMSTLNLDATIRHAVSKAKRALIEFQLPRKFSLEFEWRRFSALMRSDSSVLLPHALSVVFIRICKYYLRTSTSEMTPSGIPWKVSITLEFPKEMTPFGIMKQLSITLASYLSSIVVAHVVLAAQRNSKASENQELPRVIDDFSIIVRDVIEIKDAYGKTSDLLAPPAAAASSSGQNLGGARKDVVVGLDGDLLKMKERLLRDSSKRELAFIHGMGGIGKTTLARQVFKDPDIYTHFDVCAWVTVSQEYSLRHVLLCLLHSARILTEEDKKCQDDDDKLALYLYQYLMHRRYLIVMDDVWDIEIWDFLSRFFPENDNGSRILITSRLPSVASCLDSGSPLHHMQCLNEDESWNLLGQKAFGEEDCPLELESIGREIATSCRGLPLAIVVIGGLLYKDIQIEIWRDVAEKLKKSQLKDIKEEPCLEILGLSYNHLPHHLRPCFLYMAVLPRDCEIPVSRLINLWVAEGFLAPYASKTLEEVGEGYLKDLIDKNLISVSKRSCNGKMKTCSIHDLLRDVCVQNASKEKFLHVVDSEGYVTREWGDEAPRRLSIHPDALQVDAKHDYLRSILCIASKSIENPSAFYLGYVYLRVLDVLEVQFGEFPHQITKLVRLRYLALHYDGSLPPSIAKLEYLETIVHHSSFRKYPLLPRVIWMMLHLRHIYVKPGCYLSDSLGYQLFPRSSSLGYLQTLVGIRNFKWSKGIVERIPNLKKLGISMDVPSSVDWSTYQLDSLVDLHQLEALKIIIKYDDLELGISADPPTLAFPRKLKKLSLSGCRIPWASMRAIGALPDLEALKLRREAFCGSSWETVEEEFPKLVFLLLEELSFTRWETDDSHFPRLQHLVIRSCVMLEEIPSSIGDISTLEKIQLDHCRSSVVDSANEIQEEQESMGNEALKFEIEQRRREVDEVNMEAEGVGAGVFEVVRDAIQSGGYEILILVLGVGIIIIGGYYLSREVEIGY
ncbi:putative late blight resistance protein homolog R1A-10 [Salvia miltiorrhiza]|uniref:putative late blight resistance protein homolog R1A-10 n=1 Tax=Salvia miltiorrhiza TaxID=226208 RepID=UPI0025ABD086|nr:putative late blight resistance protein homolog R1A-10 [Salvia miltiorrhiza]